MEKIIFDNSKLNGRVREYFGTQKLFGESLDLSEPSVNKKLNNKVDFTRSEIFESIQRLNLRPEEVVDIFFKQKV